jgi:hypothetical protein
VHGVRHILGACFGGIDTWLWYTLVLVAELDYILDSEIFFSHSWTPFPNGGGVGGLAPPQILPGRSRGG